MIACKSYKIFLLLYQIKKFNKIKLKFNILYFKKNVLEPQISFDLLMFSDS